MNHLSPQSVKGIAAMYAILALIALGSILGGYAAYESHGTAHRVAKVEAQLGDQNLANVAAKYVAQAASAQGYAVKSFKALKTVVHGDEAVVTARIVVTDGLSEQTFVVKVAISRGIWVVSGMEAA